jgi:K+-transporting ATPase A subunit
MDNGAIPFALFVLPFWVGLIAVGIVLVLLIPIGINVAIRIIIDGVLAGLRGRRERAYVEKHQRDISLL